MMCPSAATDKIQQAAVTLVDGYFDKSGRRSPGFTRKYNLASADVREAVRKLVDERGYERVNSNTAAKMVAAKQSSAAMDDAAWDLLAEQVWIAMRTNPSCSILDLANRHIGDLDVGRKYLKISSCGPLLERLTARWKAADDYKARVEELESAYEDIAERPTRDQILDGLSDEEIVSRFKGRILRTASADELLDMIPQDVMLGSIETSALLAHGVARTLSGFQEATTALTDTLRAIRSELHRDTPSSVRPSTQSPTQTSKALRIALLGLLPRQFVEVESWVGQRAKLIYVEKDSAASRIPDVFDYLFVWGGHISHSHRIAAQAMQSPERKVIFHQGGTKELIKRIEKIINDAK